MQKKYKRKRNIHIQHAYIKKRDPHRIMQIPFQTGLIKNQRRLAENTGVLPVDMHCKAQNCECIGGADNAVAVHIRKRECLSGKLNQLK